MRARLVLLIVAILLVAGFAALNWPEITRSTPLNFGLFQMDGALGAILLAALAVSLLVFLISSAALRSRMLITENRYTRDLQTQRDLADKAEASRFTELRQHLDSHFRETRQREALAATEFEKSMMQSQRELRAQLEQLHHALVSRLGDLESRVERAAPVVDVPHRPVDAPPRDRVKL
jgi:biopolymer transport protein ExbB/TolQ